MKLFDPRVLYRFLTVLLVLQFVSTPKNAIGQAEAKTECGAIVESEFGQNVEEHIYLLDMSPGDSFTVSVEPVGDFLDTAISIYGPTEIQFLRSGYVGHAEEKPSLDSGKLSARGTYKIQVVK